MSDRPLIIKSTFFNISPEEMEEVRKIIKKQMEEATPVVMLPCGFELAEVNVEELENIKFEIQDKSLVSLNPHRIEGFNFAKDTFLGIIQEHIDKMKGKQND